MRVIHSFLALPLRRIPGFPHLLAAPVTSPTTGSSRFWQTAARVFLVQFLTLLLLWWLQATFARGRRHDASRTSSDRQTPVLRLSERPARGWRRPLPRERLPPHLVERGPDPSQSFQQLVCRVAEADAQGVDHPEVISGDDEHGKFHVIRGSGPEAEAHTIRKFSVAGRVVEVNRNPFRNMFLFFRGLVKRD